MLERLDDPKFKHLHRADKDVLRLVPALGESPVVAEIGVGIGATTLRIAEIMENRGELHIFDREEVANDLYTDLIARGFTNIVNHPNSSRAWDSYHWPLAKMINEGQREVFDLVFLDGAHTYLHDGLTFFLADRLMKIGGLILFDDYRWRFSASTAKTKFPNLTAEQRYTPQIKMVVDDLVEHHVCYETVKRKKIYRKVASLWRCQQMVARPVSTRSGPNRKLP